MKKFILLLILATGLGAETIVITGASCKTNSNGRNIYSGLFEGKNIIVYSTTAPCEFCVSCTVSCLVENNVTRKLANGMKKFKGECKK